MANLFFIHTPLELFVAQQVIFQESLKNNIMLAGFVGNNKHFYEVYDLMQINSMWTKKYFLDDLNAWAALGHRKLLQNTFKTLKNYFYIKRILKENKITSLYMGDMNNYSVKFSSVVFNKNLHLNISIFEEGSSHYHFQKHSFNGGKLLNHVLALLYDIFFFFPFFGVRFGKYCFLEDMPFEELPISCRYSIRPIYKEKYDKQLCVQNLFSTALKDYLDEELSTIDSDNCILFLSQPIYEVIGQKDSYIYIKTLERVFDKFDNNHNLIVKFHPREREEDRENIENILKAKGIKYKIIGGKFNIPIEYYLQFLHFQKVLCFFTSTIYYDGFIFEHTDFSFLLEDFRYVCKLNGINTKVIDEEIELIKEIKL